MPPAVRAVCLIKGEDSLYSLFRRINSLFGRETFPVLICREFVCKILKLIHDLTSKIVKTVEKIANSLLFSLFSGNSREKTGSYKPGYDTGQSN